MEIIGKEERQVKVIVNPCDVLLELANEYGYAAKNYLEEKRDTQSKLVSKNGKYILEYYEDESYHGSPYYVKKKEWEISQEVYQAIKCLKYLYMLEKNK